MSQHPSLRLSARSRKHRSVWKRFERIKALMAEDRWQEGDSVFALPKLKMAKIKVGKKKHTSEATSQPKTEQKKK